LPNGRRRTNRLGVVVPSSPYDFSTEDHERIDPVEFMAIRADDELLDALASGRSVGPAFTHGFDPGLDAGYTDDQQVLALLATWRSDVESAPFPELLSVDRASEAIVAGQRDARPRRRLMPVAAAAAVAVMALSGVAVAAGNAQPGDALWGVSTVIDANRAKSVEAAYHVNIALATAQQALAEGRVADARVALASVEPQLNQVQDSERKTEMSRKSQNLVESADATREGEPLDTDETGVPRDPSKLRDRGSSSGHSQPGKTEPGKTEPGKTEPGTSEPGKPSPSDPRDLLRGTGNPADPARPLSPTDPANPVDPANPAYPARPSNPADAGRPAWPGNPSAPGLPGGPSTGGPSTGGDPSTADPRSTRPSTGDGSDKGNGPDKGTGNGPGNGTGNGNGNGNGNGSGSGNGTGPGRGSGGGSGSGSGGTSGGSGDTSEPKRHAPAPHRPPSGGTPTTTGTAAPPPCPRPGSSDHPPANCASTPS
jgi:uncharacterized membrane protein YgcG